MEIGPFPDKEDDPTMKGRITPLNTRYPNDGDHVLYWMQASQRVRYNHAIYYAASLANKLEKPLFVLFSVTDRYPEANLRHYTFMFQGLQGLKRDLEEIGAALIVDKAHPPEAALSRSVNASAVVCDRGYLRHQRRWREELAKNAKCPVIRIGSDMVVPVETAADKEMYSARFLRMRIRKVLNDHLVLPPEPKIEISAPERGPDRGYADDLSGLLHELDVDGSVQPTDTFKGGADEAEGLLDRFIRDKLDRYSEDKNDPSLGIQSDMSPYLHFGQISPTYIALKVLGSGSPGADDFLEELIVRRELSINFVHYNLYYDSYGCLPDWALTTLDHHRNDTRVHLYSLEEMEKGETDDPYWNAAQNELVNTGKMHNYMRMYWGKRFLEWNADPEEAFDRALHLNNKYNLDGRDPNSYAGVAWCFGKHDRPWKERIIFGKVRYMNDRGLERKFDMGPYLKRHGG